LSQKFKNIALEAPLDSIEPGWINRWIPPLDAASLYFLIHSYRPRRFIEIGSGVSTKFIRRALSDCGLTTSLESIDPFPRAEVDSLCDVVHRVPFEDAPLDVFDSLAHNDIVFVDNSHRAFQNTDVTVFFTEVLPRLPSGVVYGLHDIMLPADYPEEWEARMYNEQYLLAAYLIGGHGGDEVLLANSWLGRSEDFHDDIREVFKFSNAVQARSLGGGCFWMRRK